MLSRRIDPFPHRLAGHCSSGAFRDLLEFRGLDWGAGPLSEPMVFGLAAGLDSMFLRFARQDDGQGPSAASALFLGEAPRGLKRAPAKGPPYYLGGRSTSFEENLGETIGVRSTRIAVAEPDAGWEVVRRKIDAGEPALVFADCAELDYLRAKTHMSMHAILLVGYDEGEEVAFVADNDRETIQRCSFESLRRARNSYHFPAPTNHQYFDIEWPAALPPLAEAARRAIAIVVRQMRSPSSVLAPIFGEDLTGLPALERLRAFAAAAPETLAPHLALYVEKAGTGGGLFRKLWGRFLAEVAERLRDPRLAPAADAYLGLAAAWTALTSTPIAELPAAVGRIADDERGAIERLEAFLG